jgi:hypothetical protein
MSATSTVAIAIPSLERLRASDLGLLSIDLTHKQENVEFPARKIRFFAKYFIASMLSVGTSERWKCFSEKQFRTNYEVKRERA